MFKVIKQAENGKLDTGEFKFKTEEEAEIERRIIQEEGVIRFIGSCSS
ncbi:MAG: hypothetical protein H0W77_15495 [Acidobacteria bacterium]|nr:hypothetical protein [Acidobacteriota bacterium]